MCVCVCVHIVFVCVRAVSPLDYNMEDILYKL